MGFKRKTKYKVTMTKNKYYWSEDTLEYFKERNKPGCFGQYYREVEEFVKQNCSLEQGDTYELLRDDLINQTS